MPFNFTVLIAPLIAALIFLSIVFRIVDKSVLITYKIPSPMKQDRPIRFLVFSCNFQKTVTGRIASAKSIATLQTSTKMLAADGPVQVRKDLLAVKMLMPYMVSLFQQNPAW